MGYEKPLKRSWVEIDLNQLKRNYDIYRECCPKADIMAVVKADAYGHGAVKVSSFLESLGVENWAVSNISEAVQLREAGIKGNILILGYTPVESIELLEKYNITQALISEEYADLVCKSGHSVKCQFAIDTGMNRVGLDGDFPEECIRIIRKYSSQLELDGLFTHLCVADSSIKKHVDFTKMQIDKFEIIANRLSDLKLPNIHCLNSAAGLWHKSKYNDIIRLGIILYGLKPDYMNKLPEGIIPIMAWKSVIAMVKTVKKGDTIGYGCSFKAKKDMKIATIPTGYADGYSRSLSNKGHVYINGCKANIVGKICMDQFMVDVTDVPDVNINEEVSLLGNLHNADDMAADIGTIGYEIVCSISKRVPRVYIR